MGIPEKWDSGPETNDLGPMRATRDPPSRALHLGPGTAGTREPGTSHGTQDLGSFTWDPGPYIGEPRPNNLTWNAGPILRNPYINTTSS